MTNRSALPQMTLCGLFLCLSVSCASLIPPPAPVKEIPRRGKIFQIPVLVVPTHQAAIPKGSRIVIADIEGNCATEVKDALMRRLIDNNDYSVLTRADLKQIIGETDLTWAGRFNTETAAKLGRLMGASLWIVGRVAYCGPSFASSVEKNSDPEFSLLANLQIIDLETGKVLVSSSSEGKYISRELADLDLSAPRAEARTNQQDPNSTDTPTQPELPPTDSTDTSLVTEEHTKTSRLAAIKSNIAKRMKGASATDSRSADKKETQKKNLEYIRLKAAEDMANGFADKFFSRPAWENVEMWSNPLWTYGEAIRLVKLGHCPSAVKLLEAIAATELPFMDEDDTSEYLHNYGVSLLCANDLDRAVKKLRAAYRISTHDATLKMMGLAGRLSEWSLKIALEEEPEVQRFLRKSGS